GARYSSLGDLLALSVVRSEPPFLVVLDHVQDPRNLGAILRTAEASGVHGVVVPRHHAAGLTAGAAKSAVGAIDLVPVAREANIAQCLEAGEEGGVWVVGAGGRGGGGPGGGGSTRG